MEKKWKWSKGNAGHIGMVALFVVGSGVATQLIQFIGQIDFGSYDPVVMALLNLAAVAVKELLNTKR